MISKHERNAYRFNLNKKKPAVVVKIPKPKSIGEETFAMHLRALDIKFTREFKFMGDRKWRFDFVLTPPEGAALNESYAVEIEGGTWIHGRHNRGSSIEADFDKYNEAARMGWRVFKFTTGQVLSGHAIDYIKKLYS